MAICRSCGAEIKFIKLRSGRLNPVDLELRTIIEGDGKEVIITQGGEIVRGRFASPEEGANRKGYISHFATCPYAYIHRAYAPGKGKK